MSNPSSRAVFRSFLVKIASRCNLACDYCYMYAHADQSWRTQPSVMSLDVQRQFATRLAAYTEAAGLDEVLVVFHGGEPLLAGAQAIARCASQIRSALPNRVTPHFSLQTNGLLLTKQALDLLESEEIGISLSIDGPAYANDLHRRDHQGRSSYEKTRAALDLLVTRPDVFTGTIAVIDPSVPPRDVLAFFAEVGVPALDLLLPDANHDTPPPGRGEDPDLYITWLLEAFDLWFDEYADVPLRTFDAILAAVAGAPSGTDAFGFGDVSVLTIETDGTYHDLDVLKVTEEGRTALDLSVSTASILQAAHAPKIREHQSLLSKSGLASKCQSCPVVDACGGGSVPHRYGNGSFNNPSVYCNELRSLFDHIAQRLNTELQPHDAACLLV